MTRPISLESVCEEMGREVVLDDALVEEYLARYGRSRAHRDYAVELLGSLHTSMRCDQVAKRHRLVKLFKLEGEEERRADGYVFSRMSGRKMPIVVRRERDGLDVCTIPLIVTVNGFSAVVATILRKYRGRGRANSVNVLLKPDEVRKRTIPTRALLGRPVRMVCVVHYNQLMHATRSDPPSKMYRFVRDGGIVVPFPYTREEWHHVADEVVGKIRKRR